MTTLARRHLEEQQQHHKSCSCSPFPSLYLCVSPILFMASLICCGIMRQLTTRHTPIWVPVMRSISQPASHNQRAPCHLGLLEPHLSHRGWDRDGINSIIPSNEVINISLTVWRSEPILQHEISSCNKRQLCRTTLTDSVLTRRNWSSCFFLNQLVHISLY